MTVRGVDYSHYQSPPNTSHPPDIRKMQADGIQFVILKAWEGDSPDPEYKTNLAAARAQNMPALGYVWLHSSDNHARMQECFDYLDGAVIALDWEQDGVPATVVEAWMDAYEAFAGREGLAYYGLYPPDEPTQRIGLWPRWFPEYTSLSGLKLEPWDGSPNPDWRTCWAIWQSSEKGHVDGIDGPNDLDQLAPSITLDDFKSWLDDGTPLPHRIDVVRPAIRLLQLALNHMGYDAGAIDGLWGPHTQSAIEDYSGWRP
jgi:GH25 family lysozyme M1 (1,4-beta-N-acetylmuramidase)